MNKRRRTPKHLTFSLFQGVQGIYEAWLGAYTLGSTDWAKVLLVNLDFSSWWELSIRFDTRWKIGRNWDHIRKLRDETCFLEWVSMGGRILTWPKTLWDIGERNFPWSHSIVGRFVLCFGDKRGTKMIASVWIFAWRPPNLISSIWNTISCWFSHQALFFPGS